MDSSNDDGDKHTTPGRGVEATHKSTTLAVSEELYNAKFHSNLHDNDNNNHATNMTTAASATPRRRCRRTVQDPRRKTCRPHNTSTTTSVGENHDQAQDNEAVNTHNQQNATSIASPQPQAAGGLSPSDEAAATASDSISSLSASSVSLFLEEDLIQTASAKSELDVTPTHSTFLLAEPDSSSSSPSITMMNRPTASVKKTNVSLDAAANTVSTCSSQPGAMQQRRRTEGTGATAAAARPYRDSIMVKTTASFEANCRAAAAMKTPTHSTSNTTKKAVCLLKEKRGSAAKIASTTGGVVTPSRLTRRTSAKSPILHGKNKNISPTVESPRSVTSNLLFSCPTTTSPGPPSPLISKHTTNTIVWLIRHGESIGQLASTVRRRTDPALLDCGLNDRGRQQALEMTTRYNLPPAMDKVLCSPLTRALQTAVLAFGTTTSNNRIRVHYELREFGCGKANVPENQPRPWNQVLADVLPNDEAHGFDERRIDIPSPPPNWPLHHDKTPNVLRRNYIQQIFQGLAAATTADGHDNELQKEQKHIAVVCHFHVIRAALTDPKGFCDPQLKPENATPLPCYLTKEGRLIRC